MSSRAVISSTLLAILVVSFGAEPWAEAGGMGTSCFWPTVGRLSEWSFADESPRLGESCKSFGLLSCSDHGKYG